MDAKRPDIAGPLLRWYDAHRRRLPWRAAPGEAADPYRVWLSEVMLQQTTVATVSPRFEAWVSRWPTLASLAAADEADVMAAWAGLGYYARARNLVRTARAVVAEHGGALPNSEAALRSLPGLGAYTAAAVAAIAFGQRAVVVDTNVERVVARLFALPGTLAAIRPAVRAAADSITPDTRAGDFAQAMMDLGATICTPRRPRCLLCPLRDRCAAFATGAPEAFPATKAKPDRPQRYGTLFWLECDRHVLLVRRPAHGLLGGMRALPSGPWLDTPPGLAGAPAPGNWRVHEAAVEHNFTHFRLQLALASVTIGRHGEELDGEWWPIATLHRAGLPTIFAKGVAAMRREA